MKIFDFYFLPTFKAFKQKLSRWKTATIQKKKKKMVAVQANQIFR